MFVACPKFRLLEDPFPIISSTVLQSGNVLHYSLVTSPMTLIIGSKTPQSTSLYFFFWEEVWLSCKMKIRQNVENPPKK
jgi:hypothetical protein